MTISKMEIDLKKYRGNKSTIFVGCPHGENVRRSIGLDSYDAIKDMQVVFKIPGDTTSLNPSFYLGLLFDSYKKYGALLLDKYSFEIDSNDEETKRILQKNLEDAHKSAMNSLNRKTVTFFL